MIKTVYLSGLKNKSPRSRIPASLRGNDIVSINWNDTGSRYFLFFPKQGETAAALLLNFGAGFYPVE